MTKPLSAAAFIWKQSWQFKSFMIQCLILIVLMALVNLPLPLMNKIVIDIAIPSGSIKPLIFIGLLAFFVRATASGFQVFQKQRALCRYQDPQ